MDARRFLRLSLLMIGIILSALVAPVSLVPVHAAGNLYIDPVGQAAQPAGAIVTYQVKVANMDPFNAWDIRVSTTRLSLDPVNVSLASSVVGNPLFELVNCVNGGEGIPNGQPGDIGCNIQDGPGIVHSVAEFQNLSPSGTGGLLFTMKFTAGSQDYSQVRFLDSIIAGGAVGSGTTVIHTSTEGSYGTLPGGIPTAEFSWRPIRPLAGDTISFNASLSRDDMSNSPSGIQSYDWDFRDGSRISSTITPYVDHRFGSVGGYDLIGNFSVTLTITNELGLVGSTAHVVEIKLRPPPPPLCKLGLFSIIVPNDCPTIKSAIDSIVPGGTIQVTRGSYNESLVIDKSLTLTGAGRDLTILRGDIESRAANVRLSAFTLIGSGDYYNPFRAVLNVRSPANTVSDLRVDGPVNIMDSPGTVMTSSIVDNSPLVYGPHLGLRIVNSANSTYRSNRFSELSISGQNPKDYFLDMDQSNTVNGKPIFYAVGVDNPSVPSQPGYLGFVDSSNIRISHMSMTMAGQGVLLVSTRHTVIDGVQATDPVDFVHMLNATDTVIENNVIDRATLAIFNSSITSIIDNTMTGGGIEIVGSNSSLVARNKISSPSNYYYGAYQYGSLLPLFNTGIAIIRSDNNRFADNQVSNAQLGILVSDSPLNSFERNGIDIIPPFFFPTTGLLIQNSPQNLLRNNHFTRLMTSLSVTSNHLGDCSSRYQCHVIQDYVQEIDTSNTIDTKPIFYLVSRHDATIPSDAGYIGIVNSENIKVSQANLSSGNGILVASSKNVLIKNANLTISNNGVWALSTQALTITNCNIQFAIQTNGLPELQTGIYLEDSSFAKVSGNIIQRYYYSTAISMVNTTNSIVEGNFITHYLHAGIELEHSTLNTFSRNTLIGTAAYDEIGVIDRADFNPITGVTGGPDHNLFVGNTITRNRIGMEPGVGSIIYHNNFIDNLRQSRDANPPINTWDNGAGQGNYWSDYKGQDLDHDGVGDTLVPHLGIDKYPLMKPWTPTGLAASFRGRGAWFGQTNLDNSDGQHSEQSLLARVRNNGQASEWIDIVYSITSSNGSTVTIDTGPVWLVKGQSVILPTPFHGLPGAYTVKAQLRFSSDAFLSWTNATTKSFTFKICVEEDS